MIVPDEACGEGVQRESPTTDINDESVCGDGNSVFVLIGGGASGWRKERVSRRRGSGSDFKNFIDGAWIAVFTSSGEVGRIGEG